MYCEKCEKNPATVHVTQVVNGEKMEKHLCQQCAAGEGLFATGGFGVQSLLSGLMENNHFVAPKTANVVCPNCGMTQSQFRQGGKLGCAKCYDTFQAPVNELLQKIHGRVDHCGKAPADFATARDSRRQIHALQEKLSGAIANEDYETAATLRDEIRALQQADDNTDKAGDEK